MTPSFWHGEGCFSGVPWRTRLQRWTKNKVFFPRLASTRSHQPRDHFLEFCKRYTKDGLFRAKGVQIFPKHFVTGPGKCLHYSYVFIFKWILHQFPLSFSSFLLQVYIENSTWIDWLFIYLFIFLGMHPRHMEAPRLGVEQQPLAYATATATQDPSRVCNLHYSSPATPDP